MKDSAASGVENFLPFESESFHVLAGSANFLLAAMLHGSLGGTVSLANTFPAMSVELFRWPARRAMKPTAFPCRIASRASTRPSPAQYGVSGVKAAMNLAGYRGGIPRRPLLPLTREQLEAMRQVLTQERLLP